MTSSSDPSSGASAPSDRSPPAGRDRTTLGLFEGFGLELEYMIVDRDQLDVRAVCDKVMTAEAGEPLGEIEHDDIAWSNELALHVIELKTNGPAPGLDGLARTFQQHVRRVEDHLHPMNARLMPTAAHPWMDPQREMKLWPHEHDVIYETLHRIFDCRRGHGWVNLQSAHLNLPFADDDEFARLHAAVRLVLPIIPALAASSPILGGRPTGLLDARLDTYRTNCARVPRVTGDVIPEPVSSIAEYHDRILAPLYDDLAPLDPEGILRHEWINARGAIARFDRNTIEIRVTDVQECPRADLAVAAATVAALRLLVAERWSDRAAQHTCPTDILKDLLDRAIRDADKALVTEAAYLRLIGWTGEIPCRMQSVWEHLVNAAAADPRVGLAGTDREIERILARGPLARRILQALGDAPSPQALRKIYARLCRYLSDGAMFDPNP